MSCDDVDESQFAERSTPRIYQQTHHYWLLTHFQNFFNPPPPPFHLATSWHAILSQIVSNFITQICIKACYDRMMKATKETQFSMKYPFRKDNFVLLVKVVDGKQDYQNRVDVSVAERSKIPKNLQLPT